MNTPFCENLFNLCYLCANLLFRGYLHADDNTCPKQIFPFYHQVALGLPKQFPALAKRIVVFVPHMDAAQHLVPVRTQRPAQPQIAMMVTACRPLPRPKCCSGSRKIRGKHACNPHIRPISDRHFRRTPTHGGSSFHTRNPPSSPALSHTAGLYRFGCVLAGHRQNPAKWLLT